MEDQALCELRQLILTKSDFNNVNFPDHFLLKFLRFRNFDTKKAFSRLNRFVNQVRSYPNVYQCDTNLDKSMESDVMTFTEERARDGSRIVIWRPGNWVASEVKISENCLQSVLHLMADDSYTNDGVQVVTDMRKVNLTHILTMGISGARMIAQITFSAVPVKVKKLHVINANRWTDLGIRIFLPFLKKKIAQRIILHGGDMGTLPDYCELSSLPPSLDGQIEPYSFEEKARMVDESRKWMNLLLLQIQNNNNANGIQK